MTQTLLTSGTLVTQSLERIKDHQPQEPYYLAFSGGKDSIVCYDLLEKSGAEFEAHYSVTTIDPPSLLKFIREYYPEVIRDRPTYKGKSTNFYELIKLKGLPSRQVRWCCAYLKEVDGKGRVVITGVRRAESKTRSKRPVFHEYNGKMYLNPIVDWQNNDVWDYIHGNGLPYPSLYDEGHDRIGCILCPLMCVRKRILDFHRYPKHVTAMKRALQIYLETHPKSSLYSWGGVCRRDIHYVGGKQSCNRRFGTVQFVRRYV